MSDIDEFKSYCALANHLIAAMAKEQVAEGLRVMDPFGRIPTAIRRDPKAGLNLS